jgi:hypothetical protein
MSRQEFLLALTALAIAMLVGCKEPVGLPNDEVHIASTCTTYVHVATDQDPVGFVSKWQDGQTPGGWYTLTPDTLIRRYLNLNGSYVYPKRYGFCYFYVPHFTSPNAVPVYTLFYKQKYHNSYLNLIFNHLLGVSSWPPTAGELWKAIDTSTVPLAPTQAAQDDGWCKLELTYGASIIEGIAEDPDGGPLLTGWKFDNGSSGDSTNVYGVVDYEAIDPYIKVVYYPVP